LARLKGFWGESSCQTGSTLEKSNGVYARPHPGPLPQERENHSPVTGDSEMTGSLALFGANDGKAVTAMTTTKFFGNAHSFPLSPGERAGVRASVTTNFPASRITHHASRC